MYSLKCPYCSSEAELVTGKVIYPHLHYLHNKSFYLCKPCDAYVGTHRGPARKPLGRLANKILRELKMKAHRTFDPIWQDQKMTRHEAYKWLAKELGLKKEETHIGMFDEAMCEKVVRVSYFYRYGCYPIEPSPHVAKAIRRPKADTVSAEKNHEI